MEKINEELFNKIHHMRFEELLLKIPDKSIDILLTDPPYNIDVHKSKNNWDIEFDFNNWLKLTLPKIKKNGILLIFNTKENIDQKIAPFIRDFKTDSHNFEILPIIDWAKSNPRDNLDLIRKYEYLLIAYNNYETTTRAFDYENVVGSDFLNEIWESHAELGIFAEKENEKTEHPTKKPLRLIKRLLLRFTTLEDVILDTTSGSGSIPIACWDTRRTFIASEMDKEYFEKSTTRLERLKNSLPRTVFLFETKK